MGQKQDLVALRAHPAPRDPRADQIGHRQGGFFHHSRSGANGSRWWDRHRAWPRRGGPDAIGQRRGLEPPVALEIIGPLFVLDRPKSKWVQPPPPGMRISS
jgi:hypothetical protein